MKAWMYCKLVRGTEPAAADSQGVVRVWESHQFQWALKTELLVACSPLPTPPLLSSLPLTSPFPEPFAHPPLDTRADSFPRERCLRTVPNAFPSSDPGTQPSSLFTLNRPTDIPLFDVIACALVLPYPGKKKEKEKRRKRKRASICEVPP